MSKHMHKWLNASKPALVLSAGLAIFFSFTAVAADNGVSFLRTVAEQYMLAQFPKQDPDLRIVADAGKFDSNRSYSRCEGYLTAQLIGSQIKSSSQVKITCRKPNAAYTVTVPVTVKRQRLSPVARTNISKGTVITANMLEEIWLDEQTAAPSAVYSASELDGVRLKRDVKAGDQIKQSSFCMICKGDQVNIEASRGGLSVKTAGEALEDGNLNDNIRVRNTRSGKTVQGKVAAAGLIEVGL